MQRQPRGRAKLRRDRTRLRLVLISQQNAVRAAATWLLTALPLTATMQAPSGSAVSKGSTVMLAQDVGVPVSTVGVCLSPRGKKLLEDIACATGGSSAFSELDEADGHGGAAAA